MERQRPASGQALEPYMREGCDATLRGLSELPVERFGELEEHLAGCPECQAQAERLRGQGVPAAQGEGPLRAPIATRRAGPGKPSPITPLFLVGAGISLVAGVIAPRLLDRYRAAHYAAPELPMGIDPVTVWGKSGPPRSPVLAFSIQQRQVGVMAEAPSLVPPRSTLWAAVTCGEPATVTVCVDGPAGREALWTGRVELGRRDVPDAGYRVERTGRYTFGVSVGDTCGEPAHSAWVDVPP